jgi:hypothetical protein
MSRHKGPERRTPGSDANYTGPERRRYPHMACIFPQSCYAVGAIMIGWTSKGWRVVLSDGDTYARTPSFLQAVRLARHASQYDAATSHYIRHR